MPNAEFENERGFEQHVRLLVQRAIDRVEPRLVLFESKKAVDILVAGDACFFLEVKYHRINHGRIGIGQRSGGGFQPEIVRREIPFFENRMRWVLGASNRPGERWLATNADIRSFIAGSAIGKKFNNIQRKFFLEHPSIDDEKLLYDLSGWFRS